MNSRRDALSGAKSSRDKGFKESGGQRKVALIYSGSLCLFSLKKDQLHMPSDPRLDRRRYSYVNLLRRLN